MRCDLLIDGDDWIEVPDDESLDVFRLWMKVKLVALDRLPNRYSHG